MPKKKSPPLAIKIISIVIIAYSLFSVASMLIGLVTTMPSGSLIEQYEKENPNKALETKIELENMGLEYNESTLLMFSIFGAIFFLLIWAFFILLAVFLWRGYNWSRITFIVIGFVLAPFSLIGIFTGDIFSLVYTAAFLVISLTLLLNKDVKEFYRKKKRKS